VTVFSSVQAASGEGFSWFEYRPDLDLHLVVRDFARQDGKRQRALAFARAQPGHEFLVEG
jgi:hypothetical protein